MDEMKNLNLKVTFPRDDEYDYFVKLVRLDLDKECFKDLSNGNGFLIKEPQPINKAVKSDNSIFSTKFGRSLNDENPYSHRYKCKCGHIQGAFFSVENAPDFVCPICGESVKMIGDNFRFFGYIKLKPNYCLIHPSLYNALISLIGKDNLESIIEPTIELDMNGNPMSDYDRKILRKKNIRKYNKKSSKIDSTYEGIGMLGFKEKFQEIINYFYKKKSSKKVIYDEIMANKDIVFIHSIPVYTTQLRIAKVENKRFTFEKTNADFNLLAKLAATINKDHLSVYRSRKYQNQILWDMQSKLNDLTTEVVNILSDKKGVMRSTITGRTAFSSRSVIVPDATLKMDECALSYFSLVILMEQIIINILQSSYNITYSQAYKIWYYASLRIDQRVLDIINNLIAMDKVHVLLNRNPTITYMSICWQKVVKVNLDSIVLSMNIYVLKGLNG